MLWRRKSSQRRRSKAGRIEISPRTISTVAATATVLTTTQSAKNPISAAPVQTSTSVPIASSAWRMKSSEDVVPRRSCADSGTA